MDCDAIVRFGVLILLASGCPATDEPPADTDGETDAATTDGHACHPGTTVACACSDGAMGTQACTADGQAYGMCECDAAESSTSTTSTPMTEGTADPPDTTSSGETTDAAESSSTSDGTTSAGCAPGEVVECDCGEGPGVATCVDGELGACECCMGSHPLVEGDLRFCEEGHCYCGDLRMAPPLDVCYAETIADPCCPVELECY